MDKSLAVRNTLSMADISTAATAMVKSGFFSDAKDASQAMVKIMAGQELVKEKPPATPVPRPATAI